MIAGIAAANTFLSDLLFPGCRPISLDTKLPGMGRKLNMGDWRGGGVDVRVGDRTAVRAQVDYLSSFVDILEDNIRVALGVAIRFGGS